jgi:DNA-binding MarR family transcriptional regulator
VSQTAIPYLVKRVQQACRTAIDDALRSYGLSASQFAVLRRLGDTPDLSGAELARQCFVTAQSMNELLAGMVDAGLIDRRPHPTHGRIVRTRLTSDGKRALARCTQVFEHVTERMLAGLTKSDRDRLAGYLETCARALESPTSEEIAS